MDFKPKTLEELSDRLLDEWKDGNYTFAHSDYDALATGSMMHDLFLDKVKEYFPAEEEAEVNWYADQIEEFVDENIQHLSSKYADYHEVLEDPDEE